MQGVKVLKTAVPELDERLGGGIPSNAIVLLSFQTGITFLEFTDWTVTKQMKNAHVILVNFSSPVGEIIDRSNVKSAFDSENIKVHQEESFSLIDCYTQESETTKRVDGGKVYQIPGSFGADKLYSTMRKVREGLGKDKWVLWVFDTLTNMSIGVSEEEMAKFCRKVFRLHKSYNDLAFYLLNMGAHSKNFIATITQMADIAIDFKVEEKENRLKNYVQVIKGEGPINTKKLYYETKEKRKAIFY
jgi:KaiC/GvpD/RAD55 family RecA-like ATPase